MGQWNKPGTTQPPPRARRSYRGRAAAFVVVVGGLGSWWLLFRGEPAETETNRPTSSLIAAVEPTIPKSRTNAVKRLRRHRRPEVSQDMTASIGPLPDKPMFAEAPRYGEIRGSNLFPRPLFKTREENHLAGLVSAAPGSRCPLSGFLPGEEARYLKSLDVAVEFEDRDTPAERSMKEYMIDLKQELKERVAAGEKITDIVQAARDELNAQANMRDKIIQQFTILQKEGTVEDIMQYYKEANGILKEYGMEPLALRSNMRELYETYLERKKPVTKTQGPQ